MKIVIQVPIIESIIIITILLSIVIIVFNRALVNFKTDDEPKGVVLLALMAVETIDNIVGADVYDEIKENLSPYVGVLWGYILLACLFSLTGFESPTSNFSVTLTLALITVFLVEFCSIKYNGIVNYAKGLVEPIFLFLPMNIFGKIAPIVSLSLRLFANILSGGIIMSLVYTFTSYISSFIPIIGSFNIFGVILAPFLHIYFDLVSSLLQTFIFTSLTIIFIGKELPEK